MLTVNKTERSAGGLFRWDSGGTWSEHKGIEGAGRSQSFQGKWLKDVFQTVRGQRSPSRGTCGECEARGRDEDRSRHAQMPFLTDQVGREQHGTSSSLMSESQS